MGVWGIVMSPRDASAGFALRWMRACVLAAVALSTGATAHVGAGEALPSTWLLLVVLAIVAVAAEPLLRHPASTRRVVLLLAGGEMFIHLALSAINRYEQHGLGFMAGMHHAPGDMAGQGPLAVFTTLPQMLSGLTGHAALMADAHLAAMAVVGWWLAAGERALWTVFACAVRPLLRAVQALLDAPTWLYAAGVAVTDGRVVAEEALRRPALSVRAARSMTRRGPPVGAPRLMSV